MQKLRWAGRAFFAGLAVFIAATLPLPASAQGRSGSGAVLLPDAALLEPAEGVTRAQYITALYRAAGSPEVTAAPAFRDVEPDADYAMAVAWAQARGLVPPGEDGRFRPDQKITRQEAADLLCRAFSTLGEGAQDLDGSVLAAYTGENRESDHALVPGALLEALDQRQESGTLTLTDRCVRAASNRSATWR